MIEGHAKALAKKGKGKEGEKTKGKGSEGEDQEEKADGDGDVGEGVDGDVGIRKVRMGTFEDSGLCKGCVGIDLSSFMSLYSFWAFLIVLHLSTSPRSHMQLRPLRIHGTISLTDGSSYWNTLLQTLLGEAVTVKEVGKALANSVNRGLEKVMEAVRGRRDALMRGLKQGKEKTMKILGILATDHSASRGGTG